MNQPEFNEPWSADFNCTSSICNAKDEEVATVDSDKDAARIVQCVNDCTGIADPAAAIKAAVAALEAMDVDWELASGDETQIEMVYEDQQMIRKALKLLKPQ